MWDNQTVNYDLVEHNWPEFWLKNARKIFPGIKSLEKVHEVLDPKQIVVLGNHLQGVCQNDEFIEKVDSYYNSIVPDRIDTDDWMIQRFFTIRIVIPNQAKTGRLLQFHKDEWTGNGLGIKTLWTPITKAYGSNSMQIMSLDDSKMISNKCKLEEWSFDKLQTEAQPLCNPVTLDPGQSFLFEQHHIHGNVNNETDITRWSMDGRVLPKGGVYHRKLPGGYFRFIGERQTTKKHSIADKKFISYAGWNSNWSGGIPLPMQRATINEYCSKNDIQINDYQFENEFLDWYPALEQFITSYNIDGIVLCSIYSLPEDLQRTKQILQSAVDNNVELHFANELCTVSKQEDIKHIERVLGFRL